MARGKRKSRDGGGGRSGGARKRATAESPGEAGPADTSDDPSPDEFITRMNYTLRRRLTGMDSPLTTRGHETERRTLTDMLTASIVRGESNSALIIGGRGAGKTTLVESALATAAEAEGASARGHRVVRLNGLAHADDSTALREFARQIQVELAGDDVDPPPPDAGGSADEAADDAVDSLSGRVSTGELVKSLLTALREGSKDQSQCLVVILDEFDLFAHNGKQSLLYTLLDTAQAGLTPLAVIGVTCRFDAEDLLEKRVLSRFSRRKFYLSKPLEFDEYTLAFEEALRAGPAMTESYPAASARWDADVASFGASGAVLRELRQLYDTNGRDFRALYQVAMTSVLQLSVDSPKPSAATLYAATVKQRADSKTNVMLSLSILEISLLLAMSNLAVDRADEAVNFELTYKTYADLLNEARAVSAEPCGKAYSKAVAFKAFEHLADLELVKFASGSSGTPPTFRAVHLMIENEQIADALKRYPTLPTHMRSWLRLR